MAYTGNNHTLQLARKQAPVKEFDYGYLPDEDTMKWFGLFINSYILLSFDLLFKTSAPLAYVSADKLRKTYACAVIEVCSCMNSVINTGDRFFSRFSNIM